MKIAKQLLSAGGVVIRRDRHGTRVLVLRHADTDEWRLPKGKLKEGESAAEAAEREVREEAGLDLQAGRYLGVTHYFYLNPKGSGCISKFVYFFEMDAGDGPVTLEQTFDDAEWLPPRDAVERLSWDNERSMVLRATEWR
ncbi:MAG: NUDIX domain-containing protein [Armatimonadia bacterium]|nr:NUDIX domain-containing protein [Armatimonadia bacterium]